MDNYMIIGIVIIAIIILFFMFNSKKTKNDSSDDNIVSTFHNGSQSEKNYGTNKDGSTYRKETTEANMEQEMKQILAYDIEDEDMIMQQLPDMTIEQMAVYADKITLKHINDDKFLKTQIPSDIVDKLKEAPFEDKEVRYFLLNPTVFGNSAHIALYAKEPYAGIARKAIEFLKTKL
jgi:hypothetical protein